MVKVGEEDTIKLVPCDVCGVERVPVPLDFDGTEFVTCAPCDGELESARDVTIRLEIGALS